jgi:hypothetical protein
MTAATPKRTARLSRAVTAVPAARPSPPPGASAAATRAVAARPVPAARVAPERPEGSVLGGCALSSGFQARAWVIEMPPGLALLSLNQRLHWAERNRRAQALKKAAWAMALNRKVPHLERASVVVEYQPPDRRHRDADNAATASGKPCIDGLVAAGVLNDDECPRYITSVAYTVGAPFPKGRLVLHVTEVTV